MASKVTPKTEVKASAKSKVDAKAKEAQADITAKAIEQAVPAVVEALRINAEAEANVPKTFLELVDTVSEQAKKYSLDREAVTLMVKTAIAEQYNEGKPVKLHVKAADVGSHPVLKFKTSRIVNLASPKSDATAKQIAEAREKAVPVSQLHTIASSPDGSKKAKDFAKGLGRGGNVKAKSEEKLKHGAKLIESSDELGNLVSPLIGRAMAGGLEDAAIAAENVLAIAGAIYKRDDNEIDEDSFSTLFVDAVQIALARVQADAKK